MAGPGHDGPVMRWVSFHTHTTFSYADGFGKVEDHVKRVASLGMSAVAVSEHGNVNSHVAFERHCREAGIKPIYGVEAYFGGVGEAKARRKYHIGLYAMDEEGYHNLNRIVTQSYIDSYQYPTVSPKSLTKHARGIVALSGCADSFISCSLLGGKLLGEQRLEYSADQYHHVRRKIQQFTDIFEDRFYLEVQRFSGLERTRVLNPAFARLSADTGVPLLATADVHYPFGSQNEMQKILHAARRSSTVAITEADWEYDILLTYPTSDEEITDDLVGTGLTATAAACAVENTAALAARCTVELPKARPLRFASTGADASTSTSTSTSTGAGASTGTGAGASAVTRKRVWQQLRAGWERRCHQRPELAACGKVYDARLRQEMAVISEKDFCDYFLVVADLMDYAKKDDITVGPGRGSAAGSLVCYILGITEIDPLHPQFARMIFERFIDRSRSDFPDIDIDIDDSLRWKIPQRAKEIYGPENVANVANHIKYRGKLALASVARAKGMNAKTFDAIAQKCAIRTETDDRVDDSIEDVIAGYSDDVEIQQLCETYPDQLEQAMALEGNQHSMGIHAGGFVIASDPIPEVCAVYTKTKGTGRNVEEVQVIPYEKRDAEYLGMIKMDFLGLTTMGQIGLCRKWIGMSLNELYSLFYSDYQLKGEFTHDIMAAFRADDVTGIFQYEGGTTRQVVRDVQPETFDELAACNALSRPGPLYGGQTSEYIAVKRGEKDWERIHPDGFDRHVAWTYGQIVYQEQIMFILRDLAGFSTERVLRVRKIIGKKLGEFQFVQLWDEFKAGCADNGVSEEAAAKVWAGITTAAGYAFVTSHAYSYALIAWWQMWFKLKHTAEFFASNLYKNGDGKDDIPRRTALLKDAADHGIDVMEFDVTRMKANWRVVTKHSIMPGFRQIPAIGEGSADDIATWLAGHEFGEPIKAWTDLLQIKGIGHNTIAKMHEFSLQPDPLGINKTENQLRQFRIQCSNGDFAQHGMPGADQFHTSNDMPCDDDYCAFVGIVANVVYRDEVETIRSKTGQSVEQIKDELIDPEKTKKATIFAYDEAGECALRVSRWQYEKLQTCLAALKKDYHIVVAWGRSFADRPGTLQVTQLWTLDPD